MKPRGKALGALLGISIWLLALALPQPGLASVSCQRDPAAGVLSISVTEGTLAKVIRAGAGIKVFDISAPKRGCEPGPTVRNTDRIELFSGEDSAAFIDLSRGPFAPGLTPDEDASSEIEWEVSGPGVVDMTGGRKPDHFRFMGSGVNLNPDADNDVDVVVSGDSPTVFTLGGGAGADRIDAVGHPALEAFAIGGPGNDTLVATPNGAILEGGPGSDRIIGGPGFDLVEPGHGADVVRSGGALDEVILGRDGSRDLVNCGSGRDLAFGAEKLDRLISCRSIEPN